MRTKKKLKRTLELWLVTSLIWAARLIPKRLGQGIFAGLGGVASRILKRDRRRAVDNMGIAFPEAPPMVREALVTAMFKNLGRNAFEFLKLEGASAERLADMVERVEGEEHYIAALAPGRGVVVVTGHIGCWEVMPAYFVSRGYAVSVVARRMKVDRLNDRLARIRGSVGVKSIDREDNPRRMIEVLKRGETLGVLIDQHTSVAGVYVPFFNRPAFTPTAVAKLAMVTGASIVPMGIFLNRRGKHEIHVLPPIEVPARVEDREAAVKALTEECSLAVEQLIRIDPKQWVWFHHRWREPARADVHYAVQN